MAIPYKTVGGAILAVAGAIGTYLTIYVNKSNSDKVNQYEYLKIKPFLQRGIDLSNQNYIIKNVGNGPAHIQKVIIHAGDECLNSQKVSASDFRAYYYSQIRPNLQRIFNSYMMGPRQIGTIEVKMAQLPFAGQTLMKGETITLFGLMARDEIPDDVLNQALTVMDSYLSFRIDYCSDVGKCDIIGDYLSDNCITLDEPNQEEVSSSLGLIDRVLNIFR